MVWMKANTETARMEWCDHMTCLLQRATKHFGRVSDDQVQSWTHQDKESCNNPVYNEQVLWVLCMHFPTPDKQHPSRTQQHGIATRRVIVANKGWPSQGQILEFWKGGVHLLLPFPSRPLPSLPFLNLPYPALPFLPFLPPPSCLSLLPSHPSPLRWVRGYHLPEKMLKFQMLVGEF